jgi:hypothetical protein
MWDYSHEQNSISSFKRAVEFGCGIEVDIRSFKGNLVISHDLVETNCTLFTELLDMVATDLILKKLPMCINVKEDGLIKLLAESLQPYPELDYGVFDSSFPELFKYAKNAIPYMLRISEFEGPNKLLNGCYGIWLDSLESDWITHEKLNEIINYNKKLFIVSPELHGRDHENLWKHIQNLQSKSDVYLCTDNILEAIESFKIRD